MDNNNDINKKIKDITYEVQMFCRLAILLSSYEKNELSIANEKDFTVENENEVIKYAILESFLVHARIIVKFLSRCPHYDKNYEIFISKREKPFLDDNDDIASLIKKKANPEIMHFTDRKTKTEWDVQKIACHLAEKMKIFLNEVKVDLSNIKNEINNLETNLCNNESIKEPARPISTGTLEAINVTFCVPNASQQVKQTH